MKYKHLEGWHNGDDAHEGRKKHVTLLSIRHGWLFLEEQPSIGMLSFCKDTTDSHHSFLRINVYLTKMTVSTALQHPKQGKTQLFRRQVTPEELNKIFENPRVHTKKGYQRKKKKQ